MAVIAVIFGGLIGFFTFLTALFAFETSFWMALGLYSGTGLLTTLALLLFGLILPPLHRRLHIASKHEDLRPASF